MKLGSLFTDGAVLQRKQPIAVWGETLADVLVRAEIGGNEGYAKSSDSGDFLLHLPPMEAGGPYDLKISVPENAAETITFHDIMIGDVWLCSGQSNMQYCLGSNWAPKPPEPGSVPLSREQEKEFLDTVAEPEKFRFITVPMKMTGRRVKYFEGAWRNMSTENAPEASAIGAWFGLNLRDKLRVPVGLICCSVGGTDIETWTSHSALKSNPDTRAAVESWENRRREKSVWVGGICEDEQSRVRKYARPDRGNEGFGRGWGAPELDDSDWKMMEIPGSWIGQGVSGCGAVWVRKKVVISGEYAGRDLALKLGGVDKHDITYFNGEEIGRTGKDLEIDHWNQPRSYVIPGRLVRAGENTIAVRAFSFILDGAFLPPDKAWRLSGPGLEIPLAGEWKVKAEYDLGKITMPPLPYGIENRNTPGIWFDSMIRPLLPFTIRGVIWYQGENNAREPRTYRGKMETMVRDWRFHFEQPDLPFIQVQLAGYHSPKPYDRYSLWAELRDAQRKSCSALPGVFMVTAQDIGDEDDIHPQNKKEVGRRLAASALHHVYGKAVLPCGPEYRKAVPENGGLRVFFDYADGLELRGLPGKSFYLAGADECYSPAESAVIEGDSILFSSSKVKHPVSVRYAWSDNPNNILYNRQYPAAAFMASTKDEL